MTRRLLAEEAKGESRGYQALENMLVTEERYFNKKEEFMYIDLEVLNHMMGELTEAREK